MKNNNSPGDDGIGGNNIRRRETFVSSSFTLQQISYRRDNTTPVEQSSNHYNVQKRREF